MCGPLHWLWGLALALRPAVETIFYAECNMACKAVLVARMNNSDLDTAPICPDVKQLPMKPLLTQSLACWWQAFHVKMYQGLANKQA